MARLSRLFIYPIKSTAPIEIGEAQVETRGLAHDRRYVVTDEKGRFFTARKFPKMVLIRSEIAEPGLIVQAPHRSPLELDPDRFPDRYEPVSIWKDEVQGQRCGQLADAWFSDYLGTEARLYYMGVDSRRAARGGGEVSFADSAPLLLLSQASVDDLNTRLDRPVGIRNFRPNLVVDGCRAYAEDDWPGFSIRDARFRALWPCSRCVLTTVDPETGMKDPAKEPLRTLMDYRRGDDGQAYLGLNIGVEARGKIAVGDAIGLASSEREAGA